VRKLAVVLGELLPLPAPVSDSDRSPKASDWRFSHRAYRAVKCIRWPGAWCRKDIGDKALLA
jgi:hypothetical protein